MTSSNNGLQSLKTLPARSFLYLLACAFVCLIGCTKQSRDSTDTLRLALQSELSSIDPSVCYDENCNRVLSQVYEPLLEYDYSKRPYELKPLLAAEMPLVSEDGLTYTIKIKKNVFYQNTNVEVKARDFILQIKRSAFRQTKSRGWWLFDKKVKGLNEFRDQAKTISDLVNLKVEGLQVIDDYTFKIILNSATSQFIYSLAMNFTAPIHENIILRTQNLLLNQKDTAATGPYQFTKWVKSSRILLTKNQKYRDSRLAKIQNINFSIIKEAPTRWLNFASDKIDILELNKDDHELAFDKSGGLKKEFKQQGISSLLSNSLTYWWISFNMKDSFLGKNIKLRKAIAHSIDIDKYIELFTHNLGLRAHSIYPPGIQGHQNTKPWSINYDIARAKEMLKQAGFPNGKGLPVFRFDLRNASTTSRQQGEFFKNQLSKIGIKLNIIPNSFPNFLKKARRGELQIWQDGWIMDYPDPENSLQLLYSQNKAPGPNTTSFSNPKIDELYLNLKALRAQDQQSKLQILNQAQETIENLLPWHMLYYSRYHTLTHKRVRNFIYSDVIHNSFKYLELEP